MHIKEIEDACRRVLKGDEAALEELGLDVTYQKPAAQSTFTGTLQAHYNAVLNTAVAARELQFSFLEKQCQLTLEYIQAIVTAKKVTLQNLVDGEDVAEIMLSLIDEEKQRYIQQPTELDDSKDEQVAETAESRVEKDAPPLKRKAAVIVEEEETEAECEKQKRDGKVAKKINLRSTQLYKLNVSLKKRKRKVSLKEVRKNFRVKRKVRLKTAKRRVRSQKKLLLRRVKKVRHLHLTT